MAREEELPGLAPPSSLSDRQWEFFIKSYEHEQHALLQNEELGERRLGVLLTVMSAAGLSLGIFGDNSDASVVLSVAAIAAMTIAFFSLATTARVAQRDVSTSIIKGHLFEMRHFAADGNVGLLAATPYSSGTSGKARRRPYWPSRGGLVEMVGLITSASAATGALCATLAFDLNRVLAAIAALIAFVAVWVAQMTMVRKIYAAAGILDPLTRPKLAKLGAQSSVTQDDTAFRAGVGVVLTDGHDRVLILERIDVEGAWQFPQGGIEPGEDPRQTVLRELAEELGLQDTDVEEITVHDRWLAYELPEGDRSAKTGRGQVHLWFLMRLRIDVDRLSPTLVTNPEFRRTEWVSFDEAVARAVPFRRPVYAELRTKMSRYL